MVTFSHASSIKEYFKTDSASNALNRSMTTHSFSEVRTTTHEKHRRIDAFSEVKDGWYDGDSDSKAPSLESISVAQNILCDVPKLLAIVHAYPLIEGGVSLEYSLENWAYSIYIGNSGVIEVCGVELDGDRSFDGSFKSYQDARNKVRSTVNMKLL